MEYSLVREHSKVVDGVNGIALAMVGKKLEHLEFEGHPLIENLLKE